MYFIGQPADKRHNPNPKLNIPKKNHMYNIYKKAKPSKYQFSKIFFIFTLKTQRNLQQM